MEEREEKRETDWLPESISLGEFEQLEVQFPKRWRDRLDKLVRPISILQGSLAHRRDHGPNQWSCFFLQS